MTNVWERTKKYAFLISHSFATFLSRITTIFIVPSFWHVARTSQHKIDLIRLSNPRIRSTIFIFNITVVFVLLPFHKIWAIFRWKSTPFNRLVWMYSCAFCRFPWNRDFWLPKPCSIRDSFVIVCGSEALNWLLFMMITLNITSNLEVDPPYGGVVVFYSLYQLKPFKKPGINRVKEPNIGNTVQRLPRSVYLSLLITSIVR